MRHLFIILFCILGLGLLKAQEITETDSLPPRFILILPTVTDAQLALVKAEFAKYPQIQSATFIYKNHHALLIELAEVVNTQFLTYADIMKVVAIGIKYNEIFIKIPVAYDQILSTAESNNTTYLVK